MSSYYLPDLTGRDPDYEQVNVPFYIWQNNIPIAFENSPIFVSSLKISTADGSGIFLEKDVDWTVTSTDVDYTAMSRAKLQDPSFSEILVKSVSIVSTKAIGRPVAMTFQEFYLTTPGRTYDDGTPFEFTPDIAKSLVTGLADVRQQVVRVTSPIAPVDHAPNLFPLDINKEKSSNQVTGEIVAVNTVAGAKVIQFTGGAFFADSVTLLYNGSLLDPLVDFIPIGVSPLTKETTNTSGIYRYILLNTPATGTVTASYHAVGGEVQINDINAVYELMTAIKMFLNNNIFVTSQTIPETQAFRAVNTRLNALETNMRNILTGSPTYGDTSSGKSVVRPVATNDANFHWWTIAKLYQVAGSTDVISADQFKGRVYFPSAKISLAFTLDVNLYQSRNIGSFTTDNLVFDPGYVMFSDLSVNAPVYPMVRLVWNQSGSTLSGAYLQIGLPLTSLTDRMVVEDLSSVQSCWILDQTNPYLPGSPVVTSSPSDEGFTLPDGQSVWTNASNLSHSKIYVPKYTNGYLVYTGSVVTLSQLNTQSSTANNFTVTLPPYFPLPNIASLVVTVASSDASIIYDVEIPLPNATSSTKTGKTSFVDSANELVALSTTLTKNADGSFSLSLNTTDLTPAANNSMTDIVRYVRARV